MAPPAGGLVLVSCLALMAVTVARAADAEAPTSVVVGLAKCAGCTRKNMRAEEVFKALQVVINCNNRYGEVERKAVGTLDSSGAFSVPLAADDALRGDCFAQLNSAEGTPCNGQDPSWIHPLPNGTFVAVAGKVYASSQCSAAICGWIKQHYYSFHNHKKQFINHFFHGSPSPAPSSN